MSDWSQVLQDDSEREAFFSLLDQYFARDTAPVLTASTPHTTSISTSRPAYVPPAPAPAVRTLPEPVPTQSFSSRFQDNTAFKNSLAGAALKNTSVTSAALRNAGMSAGAANAASKFGSQHSEVLAPHLANAAQQGWNNRSGAASTIGITAKAPGPAPKGPHRPAGLSSSKSIAGGFSTESGGAFGKSLFSSKGPMSSEEARKNEFKEALVTRTPSPRASPNAPPLGSSYLSHSTRKVEHAVALYDYAATDETDLQVREGERVVILERVSSDWTRCQNDQGLEGLVPATYLQDD